MSLLGWIVLFIAAAIVYGYAEYKGWSNIQKYGSIIIVSFIWPWFFSSDDLSSSDNSNPRNYEKSNNTITGTYKMTDYAGQNFIFVINEDGTATVTVNGATHYASWRWWDRPSFAIDAEYETRVHFDWWSKPTKHYFIKDGYLYIDNYDCNMKHPEKRLKITKR